LIAILLLALSTAGEPQDLSSAPVDLAHAAQLAGPARGPRLTGQALEDEAKRVAGDLRCPVCQGLSVGDSPSAMATNMRRQVRELLAGGFDREQVLTYFEASYGEFVRLDPPLRGVNWLVWLAPAAGLALGLVIVFRALRPAPAPSTGAPPATAEGVAPVAAVAADAAASAGVDPVPDDPALAGAVRRVREMAYGWPGGVRPGKTG
jgi:cytochrome c-type biogenesis protein CcmH